MYFFNPNCSSSRFFIILPSIRSFVNIFCFFLGSILRHVFVEKVQRYAGRLLIKFNVIVCLSVSYVRRIDEEFVLFSPFSFRHNFIERL